MKAKEYFEGIRAEVVKTDKARDMLERMKAKEGAKTQSYTGGAGAVRFPIGHSRYCSVSTSKTGCSGESTTRKE